MSVGRSGGDEEATRALLATRQLHLGTRDSLGDPGERKRARERVCLSELNRPERRGIDRRDRQRTRQAEVIRPRSCGRGNGVFDALFFQVVFVLSAITFV